MSEEKRENIIIFVIAVFVAVALTFAVNSIFFNDEVRVKTLYVAEGIITCLDFDEDIITIETKDGNLWEAEGIQKTFHEGQTVYVIMNNNFTAEIWDDIIIKIQ